MFEDYGAAAFALELVDAIYQTRLHQAVYLGDLCQVRRLLENDGNASPKNKRYETPLHIACSREENSYELCRLLLEKGASCNEQDIDGRTPFSMALK